MEADSTGVQCNSKHSLMNMQKSDEALTNLRRRPDLGGITQSFTEVLFLHNTQSLNPAEESLLSGSQSKPQNLIVDTLLG